MLSYFSLRSWGLAGSGTIAISILACVAWWFWLGALSNKGGRGQRNREEIGAGATWNFFSRLRRLCARPVDKNRHATQAISIQD